MTSNERKSQQTALSQIKSRLRTILTEVKCDSHYFITAAIEVEPNKKYLLWRLKNSLYKTLLRRSRKVFSEDERLPHVIQTDLERYYQLLELGKSGIEKLETLEIYALLDLCNGDMLYFNLSPLETLRLIVEDSLAEQTFYRYQEVDPLVLRAKIEQFNDLEALFLLDAIEKYWSRIGDGLSDTESWDIAGFTNWK